MPDVSYDMSKLKIDPHALGDSSQRIDSLGKKVADAVVRINNVTSNLELSWVGKSAQEAQEFSDQWKKVMTHMFGDSDTKTNGVLPVMAGGLKGTAIGFSHTELGLWKFFNDLNNAMNSGGSGGGTPSSSPEDVDDMNSAVYENFPQ
ncbi:MULTISPECIES: WXG100 family type VII secretion target [Streptomyces]|uniref:WXG100 family type VII secretion target n=1 Tax=Streptomyces TaxID=1883 RepID=UPI0023DD60E4|nr:WXG100 family type VII secretion target [Streptomyces sp. FXJ1.172]WEP00623.1 WXG100 family type VII secretion target [Streptomyces sp. FXJ1.172]